MTPFESTPSSSSRWPQSTRCQKHQSPKSIKHGARSIRCPSATDGNHYLNNHANELAHDYAEYELAGVFPVGAIIAKDSFAKTETGGILLGPLFLMEKMPGGFNYASGDWKYTLIGPDGVTVG